MVQAMPRTYHCFFRWPSSIKTQPVIHTAITAQVEDNNKFTVFGGGGEAEGPNPFEPQHM